MIRLVGNILVFIGTYTGGDSRGIYVYRFDPDNGLLEPTGQVAETPSPSYLAISPDCRFVYAVNEIGRYQGQPGGSVSAFAFDVGSTALTHINTQPTHGAAPCHITLEPDGGFALVANYSGGNLALFPIRPDGGLEAASSVVQHEGAGPNERRQRGPHAHSIWTDPSNRYVLAADLGIDRVMLYRLDRDAGALVPRDPPSVAVHPGAGPRHLDFHPNGRFMYVVNELDSTVSVFAVDAGGPRPDPLQTVSTLPAGFSGNSTCAEIHVSADGRFVYASNRGHDSIAVFAADSDTGGLTSRGQVGCGGKTPRSFALDPSGRFMLVANQNTDNVVVFRIEDETGLPVPAGHEAAVPAPVCVKVVQVPAGE